LLQAKPDILSKELRVFFCKYNDPPYVKLQKLEIMVRIANDKNVDQLLAELKEYALEVDMDFVRRAVKAIGQAAIKIESASEKCVNTLLDLIATKVNYVVQEAIVVIKDIFRKYPGYEGIIPTLCKYIDELDEPNARGALIWIVGEYAEKISNADEILAGFVEGFMEEFTQVQLQILTAVVKLFLKKPDNNQGLVQKVLQAATAENDNPDIRDRAYVYWRLLSGDLQVAKVNMVSSITNKANRIRTSSFPRNLLLLQPCPPSLQYFWTNFLRNSPHSPPSITNYPRHLSVMADMVRMQSNTPQFKSNGKMQLTIPSLPQWSPPKTALARPMLRIFLISTSMAPLLHQQMPHQAVVLPALKAWQAHLKELQVHQRARQQELVVWMI
jgi:vesicle coat complex subunit